VRRARAGAARADVPIGQNFLPQMLRCALDRSLSSARAGNVGCPRIALRFALDDAMLARCTPAVDPQLFAAAERVMQWHRQRPSWQPIGQPLPADDDGSVPLAPDAPSVGQDREPDPEPVSRPPAPAA
jgi:hypothetical protein